MTVNEAVQAIANKLAGLWPDKKAYVDEMPNGADGNFCIRAYDESQTKELDRRHKRQYHFDISYFEAEHDVMSYHDWAETMFLNFDTIVLDGRLCHANNHHAENNDRIFHFLFDVSFLGLFPAPDGSTMENLIQEGGIKT